MAQKFGRLVEEDLNVGTGAVWITAPGGGKLRATQIGLHTVARGQQAYTETWAPGAIAAGASASTTLTVPDATTADFVLASHDKILTSDLRIVGNISADDTAQVVIHNPTSAAITVASGTVSVIVFPSIGIAVAAPEAHFSWTSDAETEVLRVDATTSTGTIDTYEWDFGDSSGTDTGVSTVYDYGGSWPNNFTVTLTVTGPGGSDQVSTQITTGDQIGGSV